MVTKLCEILTWSKYFFERNVSLAKSDNVVQPFHPNTLLNSKISVWKGDITKIDVDAIVNAACPTLLGGGGVDGAIHRAAGNELFWETSKMNGCAVGEAKITKGYKLPAKHIIHTVGTMQKRPEELAQCYKNSFRLMIQHSLKSIVFPCISTGVYGYDSTEASKVALYETRMFLNEHFDKVDRVVFCVFLEEDLKIYEEQLQIYFPIEKVDDQHTVCVSVTKTSDLNILGSDGVVLENIGLDQEPSFIHIFQKEKIVTKLEEILTWSKYFIGKSLSITKTDGAAPTYQANPTLNNKISVWKGDITTIQADAIVTAANPTLFGGGGVDGAIHRAAGDELFWESSKLNGCEIGEAKITKGYRLPAKHVIHTVGTMKQNPEELANCYKNSFRLLVENSLRSIVFPCISTGVYGYDPTEAAKVALHESRSFLNEHHEQVDRVVFCVFQDEDLKVYEEQLQKYFPVENSEEKELQTDAPEEVAVPSTAEQASVSIENKGQIEVSNTKPSPGKQETCTDPKLQSKV